MHKNTKKTQSHKKIQIKFLVDIANTKHVTFYCCVYAYRSSVEKLKNAKTADISAKSMMDCQLQSMSQTNARENGGISTPLVDGSLMRQSPQLMMSDAPDADDTDPDVIPNQYGKCLLLDVCVCVCVN